MGGNAGAENVLKDKERTGFLPTKATRSYLLKSDFPKKRSSCVNKTYQYPAIKGTFIPLCISLL
jgi:hypothetical protein